MLKDRHIQVKLARDTDAAMLPPVIDLEASAAHVAAVSKSVGLEATKLVAATLVLNAACKILINRLSK